MHLRNTLTKPKFAAAGLPVTAITASCSGLPATWPC